MMSSDKDAPGARVADSGICPLQHTRAHRHKEMDGKRHMRDLHYDGAFARDFNQASKNWSWATWHQIQAAQVAVAQRLLEEVFGPAADDESPALGSEGDSEE